MNSKNYPQGPFLQLNEIIRANSPVEALFFFLFIFKKIISFFVIMYVSCIFNL